HPDLVVSVRIEVLSPDHDGRPDGGLGGVEGVDQGGRGGGARLPLGPSGSRGPGGSVRPGRAVLSRGALLARGPVLAGPTVLAGLTGCARGAGLPLGARWTHLSLGAAAGEPPQGRRKRKRPDPSFYA